MTILITFKYKLYYNYMFYTLMLIYYFYNLKNIISVKKELVLTVYKTHNDEDR